MSPSDDNPGEIPLVTVVLARMPIDLYWRVSAHSDALAREFALLAASSDDRPIPKKLTELMDKVLAEYGGYEEPGRQKILEATERGDTEVTVSYTVPASLAPVAVPLLAMWEEAEAYCREGVDLFTLAAPAETSAFRRWSIGELTRQAAGELPISWPEYVVAHGSDTDSAAETHTDPVSAEGGDDGNVLVLRGEIDLETAPKVRSALQRMRDAGATTIVVDAQAVEFLDSVGISVLIAARERLLNDGGGLIVRSPSQAVRRTLKVAGLSAMFHIDDSNN